jgi:Na+/proline symporter
LQPWSIGVSVIGIYLVAVLYIGYRSWRVDKNNIEDFENVINFV